MKRIEAHSKPPSYIQRLSWGTTSSQTQHRRLQSTIFYFKFTTKEKPTLALLLIWIRVICSIVPLVHNRVYCLPCTHNMVYCPLCICFLYPSYPYVDGEGWVRIGVCLLFHIFLLRNRQVSYFMAIWCIIFNCFFITGVGMCRLLVSLCFRCGWQRQRFYLPWWLRGG